MRGTATASALSDDVDAGYAGVGIDLKLQFAVLLDFVQRRRVVGTAATGNHRIEKHAGPDRQFVIVQSAVQQYHPWCSIKYQAAPFQRSL